MIPPLYTNGPIGRPAWYDPIARWSIVIVKCYNKSSIKAQLLFHFSLYCVLLCLLPFHFQCKESFLSCWTEQQQTDYSHRDSRSYCFFQRLMGKNFNLAYFFKYHNLVYCTLLLSPNRLSVYIIGHILVIFTQYKIKKPDDTAVSNLL